MANEKLTSPVIIKIPQGEEKKAETLRVYVVSAAGAVIEAYPLKSGKAQLKTTAANLHNNKIYIAPDVPAELGRVPFNEKLLIKMGAWQPSFRISADNIIQLPYFPTFPFPFPFGWCDIRGTVSKTFNVNGVPTVLPICNAKVHICDVTPIKLIISQIPVAILTDLRDRLVKVIKQPIPIPIPDPAPNTKVVSRIISKTPVKPIASVISPKVLENVLPIRPTFPANVQNGILSGSIETFSNVIVNNFDLFHPYLCWWPWFWPYFYISDPIATVTTDCNGRFNYNMFYFLANHPNVYVWVEVLINGSWVTVYKPAISCFTRWNYACGTDINISVTNPDVLPCFCDHTSVEPDYLWVKNVNNGATIRSIQQLNGASGHLGNTIGLTAYGTSGNISPFGSSFPFVLQFGDGLAAHGVTHYRWSYQMQNDAYLNPSVGAPQIVGGNVSKTYSHWIEVTPGDWEHLSGVFPLGPYLDGSGKVMYKIPHNQASVDTGIAGVVWDTGLDTASIGINTVGWTPGLYKFTLELLNSSGTVVPLTYNPFKVSRIAADPGPVIPGIDTIDADTVGNYVTRDVASKIIGFNFVMRVDNDPCYAGISDAIVAGGSTDTECGTGYYKDKNNDKVELIFQGGQPHNFATYDFNVYKGNSGALAVAASSGTSANANNALVVTTGNNAYDISQATFIIPVPAPIPVNPVNPVPNMDQYHKAILVKDMVGTCTMAAFSENLNVYATHTNGYNRLNGYDAHYIAAIAIAPNS